MFDFRFLIPQVHFGYNNLRQRPLQGMHFEASHDDERVYVALGAGQNLSECSHDILSSLGAAVAVVVRQQLHAWD